MIALTPAGVMKMTAVITDCHDTFEMRIVDQVTGNTLVTDYRDNENAAIALAEQYAPDRVEFETL